MEQPEVQPSEGPHDERPRLMQVAYTSMISFSFLISMSSTFFT